MKDQLTSTLSIWRLRSTASTGDRAYIAYSAALLSLVVMTPAVRAIWILLVEANRTGAVLTSAPQLTAALCLALGACAVVGMNRGPIVFAPFLTHVLVESGFRGRRLFSRRVIACGVITSAAGAMGGLLAGSAAAAPGVPDLGGALTAIVRGALIGALLTASWFLGQAATRTGMFIAITFTTVAALALLFRDSAWTYVLWVDRSQSNALVTLTSATFVIVAALSAPRLLDRIHPAALMEQAANWDLAIAHAVSLELNAASGAFRGRPTTGRHMRIAPGRSSSMLLLVLRRDLVGAARTPGRLASGILSIVCAGVCIAFGGLQTDNNVAFGVIAALVLFTGVGPVARGLFHAVDTTRDLPILGITDARLVVLHGVLPMTCALLGTLGGVALVSISIGEAPQGSVVWAASFLPVLAVAARTSDALRGPSPVALLTPAPSALGDPTPILRLLWATDAIVITLFTGGVLLSPFAAAGSTAAAIVLGLTLTVRWIRRS